jgi:hypothetical protein
MKVIRAFTAVLSTGTSLFLLSGIRCTQAVEIKIVSPSVYKDIEGEGALSEDCCSPSRYQQVFPAEDFSALGNKPHWLVVISGRPDQSLTSPRTVYHPDNEYRLTTMPVGPPNLSLRFGDNLGSNFKHWYRGPVTSVAEVAGPGPGPREFYNADRPAGVTPYLYDRSQGNLLMDVISWQGASPSPRQDQVPSIQTALAGSPFATQGGRIPAFVRQFTFIPVTPGDYNQDGTVDAADYVVWRKGLGATYTQTDYDVWHANFGQTIGSGAALPSAEPLSVIPEPSTALLVLIGSLAFAARCRPTHVSLRRKN